MLKLIPIVLLSSFYYGIAADGQQDIKAEALESSLSDFFQEPKLGTSWYNPNGPTPSFDMAQKNGTSYLSRLGADVLMSCQVSQR